MVKKIKRGFVTTTQWAKRAPWLEPSSLGEYKEWARSVVPASLAYRLYYATETEFNLEIPQIEGWTFEMKFAAKWDASHEWAVGFASHGDKWADTSNGRAAFTLGIKLLCFAMRELVHDEESGFPIPSYNKADLCRADELRRKISDENLKEYLLSLLKLKP